MTPRFPANVELAEQPSSFLGRFAFPLLAWGLVLHSLIIAALFGWFGLPEQAVRAIAAWKEVALVLLIILVMVRAATGHGPPTTIALTDLLVGGLMATAVFFLLAENLWLRYSVPRTAELLGIRDAVYFMLLYFVGRAMPELASSDRAMRTLFVVLVATCVIGIVERFFVGPEMLVALGVASYFQEFLGVASFTAGNDYGLPMNYWTMIGGQAFRRAGSVYLNGQGFAVPFLLFFPVATAWIFMRPRVSRAAIFAYVVILVGLLLTLTRMTIAIALIQLILFVTLWRRPVWAVGGLAAAAAVLAVAFALIPGFPMFVWHTLTWQEGSSASHAEDWAQGLMALAQRPWGWGLGTTDQTAVRAGLEPITGDNLYLKYGVELGLIALAFLVLLFIAIAKSALRTYRQGATHAERRMGIALFLATVGIAINGITAVVFNSIALGWLFFWLAGAVVTVAERLPRTAKSPAPLELSPAI
ncbi:MAG: O-antigen ligase family protein [Gemmatimonadaceae bacterium]